MAGKSDTPGKQERKTTVAEQRRTTTGSCEMLETRLEKQAHKQ
jgi:hypothetical protein